MRPTPRTLMAAEAIPVPTLLEQAQNALILSLAIALPVLAVAALVSSRPSKPHRRSKIQRSRICRASSPSLSRSCCSAHGWAAKSARSPSAC
jgi:hypothetical protein